MAITFPLDVPLEQFSDLEVEMVNINSVQVSTFTGQDTVQLFEGDYWKIRLTYTDLDRDLAQPIIGFIAALRQSEGTFVVTYPGYQASSGAAATNPSSPLVNGSGNAGTRELPFKNAVASMPGWLLAGDIIQVGPDTRPHWHVVTADVDTDVNGQGTIDIWPSARSEVSDNDQIITETPRGIFRLLSAPSISIRSPVIHRMTLECREVTG